MPCVCLHNYIFHCNCKTDSWMLCFLLLALCIPLYSLFCRLYIASYETVQEELETRPDVQALLQWCSVGWKNTSDVPAARSDPVWCWVERRVHVDFHSGLKFECKNTKTFKQHHVECLVYSSSLNAASMGREEKDVKALITLSSRVFCFHMHSYLHVFTEFSFALTENRIESGCLFEKRREASLQNSQGDGK